MTRLWLAAGTQSEAAHVHSRWTSVLRKPGCLSARPGRRGPRQAARLRSRIRRPALHSDHLGLSPRILGRWGRKPKSRIVGPRKQGAWGSDGTPAGHPHSGAAPATVRPAPRPPQASPSPPLTPQLSGVASNPLWDRAESECYPVDGGLSEPHRGRRGLRAGGPQPQSGRLGWPGSPRGDRGSRRFRESRVHLWPRRTSSRCAVPPLPSGSKLRDAGRPNRPPPTPRGPHVFSVCPLRAGLGWFL